jgi:hypothetical protein
MRPSASWQLYEKANRSPCVMLIFDVLSGRLNSPNLLSVLDLITPRYPTRGTEFLRIDFHRTNIRFSESIVHCHAAVHYPHEFSHENELMHQLIFVTKLNRYFLILQPWRPHAAKKSFSRPWWLRDRLWSSVDRARSHTACMRTSQDDVIWQML